MTLKEKIKNDQFICGTMVNLPLVPSAEILGYFDYDYLWIDLEHSPIPIEVFYSQLVAAKSVGKPTVVRVPQNDLTYTKKVLEMGPDAVLFPMVHNAKEAEQLMSYTLYPPYGTRGCGPQRATRYGLDDEPTYYRTSRDTLCRFLQIECKTMIDELDEIAKNPYIDGFVIGFADLAGSINETGNFFCEKNLELAKRAIEICKKHGKMVGTATLATEEKTIQMFCDSGLKMITCGADWKYMSDGAKATYNNLQKVFSNNK